MASDKPISIVGIGASAGGLDALEALFRGVPADTSLAFIIVTHLPSGHSSFREILSRYSVLAVVDAEDEHDIVANRIYVCPSDHVLTVANGATHLRPRIADRQRHPIDVFLSSLAQDCGEACVGIVLSGGGTDGTLGIKAIKEKGGFTLAQGSNGSAPLQSGMPDTAVAAGVVDLVLPVEEMAERLSQYADDLRMSALERYALEVNENQVRLELCKLLLKQTRHDFSGYKAKTFMRRVYRRMKVLQLSDLNQYAERLQEHPDELTLLFRDLLIGVTNFFRDPPAFEALASQVIPALFENKGAADTVRVWVPGCATGEEVYSLAILLREYVDSLRVAAPKVQIFATDIDEPALSVARAGRYPVSLLGNVSRERLNRFFVGEDVTYVVGKDIRDLCMFSPHNVLRDLQTVNTELNSKIDEVDRANTDLRNVFDSTQIATIFLDRNLIIRSFTPSVTQIFESELAALKEGRKDRVTLKGAPVRFKPEPTIALGLIFHELITNARKHGALANPRARWV